MDNRSEFEGGAGFWNFPMSLKRKWVFNVKVSLQKKTGMTLGITFNSLSTKYCFFFLENYNVQNTILFYWLAY